MKQTVCHTTAESEEKAVSEIFSKLGSSSYDVILYCSSIKYDFDVLTHLMKERFPNVELMGSTSCGEISCDGFTDKGIVACAISCPETSVKGMIFDDVAGALYVHKDEVEQVAFSCGIKRNDKNAFALTFITGLYNGEENVLAALHTILGEDLAVVGGTAGDDLLFKQTKVSYNGRVSDNGVAILLFKTSSKFTIYRENIFAPTGKTFNITNADVVNRKVISLDNMNPLRRYAEVVGLSENEVRSQIDDLKVGRVFGKEVFISAMQAINSDGTINFYSRLLPNSQIEALKLVDPVSTAKETCSNILNEIPKPGFVFMSNCVQRTMRFKASKIDEVIINEYNNAFNKNFCGFTTYGEQINRIHSNSTLVILAVEE